MGKQRLNEKFELKFELKNFSWACLPQLYLLQRLFTEPGLAYTILFCVSVFLGVNTLVAVMMVSLFFWMFGFRTAYMVMRYAFLLIPQYCLGGGMVDLARNEIMAEIFQQFGDENAYESPFSFNVIGWNYLALALEGLVLIAANIVLDYQSRIQTS